MNLLKTFPEIELFFNIDKFTQEELLLFLIEIEKKYEDEQLRKAVSTLISLKILQYETFPVDNSEKINIVARTKKINYKPVEVDDFHPLTNELKLYSIENIANSLEWPLSRTLRLLEQNGITKKGEDLLDPDEFIIIKDMLNNRLLGLERIHKIENPIKKINNKLNNKLKNRSIDNKNNNDVYSRIQAIGLGKVIYIRKK